MTSTTSRPSRRGQQRGEAGAAGAGVLDGLVDHRHRGVRAEPVDRADEVEVEQGVADDDERARRSRLHRGGGRTSGVGRGRLDAVLGRSAADRSVDGGAEQVQGDQVQLLHGGGRRGVHGTAPRRRRRPAGWAPAPVIAQTVSPPPARRPRAARTLGLRPLVDMQTKTSPGRPCAWTCRAKTSSEP